MESLKPKMLHRLHQFAHQHKILVLVFAVISLLLASGLIIFGLLYQKPKIQAVQQQTIIEKTPAQLTAPQFFSPLTGLEVADVAATSKQVRAIMIENSPDARPQSGLKDVGIVFEAIAEGGITRFLCLYQETRPGLIGPVRSLRPYYVDWLAPFDASVSHVGGSLNALNEIRNGTYKDIDQFFNGGSYWRATDRYAPHNVYTSSDKLDELNNKKGYTSSNFTGFPRKAESPSTAPNATKIDIDISYGLFNVHYDYNLATNTYNRSEGGQGHSDREAGAISPKTVIVMKVPMHRGFEDGYREQMDTIGNGQAFVFQDGTVTEVGWSKSARKAQITFKDGAGNTVPLNPGQTWISIIAPNKGVTWR